MALHPIRTTLVTLDFALRLKVIIGFAEDEGSV